MKKLIICSLVGLLFAGCVNMDIPKKNAVTEPVVMSSAAGVDKYMARLYAYMPVEDFKYEAKRGFETSGWNVALGVDGTGECVTRESGWGESMVNESRTYWNAEEIAAPFKVLRDCNVFIENFPNYQSNFATVTYENYLGQAYFMRAFVFYTMAKRFGGIPLVTHTINYPEDDVLEVPRSSEEETWDQIRDDFDMAISLLAETSDIAKVNKYVALTYKAEAMNYAGSVAKYNDEYGLTLNDLPNGTKTGVKVIGFEDGAAASRKYFAEAYKAANAVIESGRYDLRQPSANTPQAKYENMAAMFSDKTLLRTNPENIFAVEYIYPTKVHEFDAFNVPSQLRRLGIPLSAASCPTLDFVELFDGLPRNAAGRIKVTSGDNNTQGNYLMFDKPMDLFANAEPRLRAYVIFPGDTFRGEEIEIWTGVYTGAETDIQPLGNSNGNAGYAYSTAGTEYPTYSQVADKKLFVGSHNWGTYQNDPVTWSGGTITENGASGPFSGDSEGAMGGFALRKWLVTDTSYIPGENDGANASQPFILLRYADVLLAAAESAVELSIAGVASPDGSDMLSVATDAVKRIQDRAGAVVMTGTLTGTNASRDIVRKERRKELALEHKTKWDIRRWRVIHREGRDGFWGKQMDAATFSNGNATEFRFRGLYPFFSTSTGKWFFDDRFQYRSLKTYNYNMIDYYFEIPTGEVNKSPMIDQQPNRYQN